MHSHHNLFYYFFLLLCHSLSLPVPQHLSPIRCSCGPSARSLLFWHVKCILKLRLSNCLSFLPSQLSFNSIYLHAFFNYKKNINNIMFVSGKMFVILCNIFVLCFFFFAGSDESYEKCKEKTAKCIFCCGSCWCFALLRLLCALKYATLYNTQTACLRVCVCVLVLLWHYVRSNAIDMSWQHQTPRISNNNKFFLSPKVRKKIYFNIFLLSFLAVSSGLPIFLTSSIVSQLNA